LLTCLAGAQKVSSGRVTLDGIALHAVPPRSRAQTIGYLPQSQDLHWALTARTVVELGRLPHHGHFAGLSTADHQAVDAALAQTDIGAIAHRLVTELSGGERARVMLARVLAGHPAWILADEPLTHLDPAHQLDALNVLKAASRAGAGVCLVLHDLSLAARYADRLILMHQGRVVAAGTALAVLTSEMLAQVYQIRADVRCDADGVSITAAERIK
jgi:iron complex transport system ATP-binding protein